MSSSHIQTLSSTGPEADDLEADVVEGDARRSPGSRIVRNIFALSLSRPLTWVAAIGMTVLLPRYLGDVNLGKINFAFAFADWCGLLASLGISTYLTKEVSRRGRTASALVLNALVLRLALALGIGAIAAVVATFFGFDQTTRHLIYLLTAHMLLMVMSGVLIGALQGRQQLRVVGLVDAISKIVQIGLVAVVLIMGYGPIGVAVAWIVSDVITIAWYLFEVNRRVGLAGRIEFRTWWSLILGGMPFLVWETALLTYARIDVIILSFFATDAVIGWYGAAYRIISIPLFVPAVLMTVMFPALTAAASRPSMFNAIARRAIHVTVLSTVPMAFGLMVLADKLIELLRYPAVFSNSVIPVILLSASLPLVGVNMIVGSMLNARDRQRQWAIAGVAAAVLNPALNFIFIPYTQARFGNGGIGAAAVTSLTEVFLLLAGQFLLPRGVLDLATLVGVLKCLVAGLLMAAVVWLARGLPVLVTIPIGALIYGAGTILLGTVSMDDLKRVRGYLVERSTPVSASASTA